MQVFYRPSDDAEHWRSPYILNYAVSGCPRLLQSEVSVAGNFELLIPPESGGLQHFWRDNSLNERPWLDEPKFAENLRGTEPVALFETIHRGVSDLLTFAVCSGEFYSIVRTNYRWGNPIRLAGGPISRGRPAAVRSRQPGEVYEFFVPVIDGGTQRYDFDAATSSWSERERFAMELDHVDAVAAVADVAGCDVVARCGTVMYHVTRNGDGAADWTKPLGITV
jgi:hypothetical protein